MPLVFASKCSTFLHLSTSKQASKKEKDKETVSTLGQGDIARQKKKIAVKSDCKAIT